MFSVPIRQTPFQGKASKQADAKSNMAYYTSLPGQPIGSEQYFDDNPGNSQQRANSLQQFPDRQHVMNRPIIRDVHPGYQNLNSAMTPVYVVQQPQLAQQPAGIAYAAPPTQVNVAPAAPVAVRDAPEPQRIRDVEKAHNVVVKSGSGSKTCMTVSLTLLVVFVLGGIGVGVGLYLKTKESGNDAVEPAVTEPITCGRWIKSYGQLPAGEHNLLESFTTVAEKMGIDTSDKKEMLHTLFFNAKKEGFLASLSLLKEELGPDVTKAISQVDWDRARSFDWESYNANHDGTDTGTSGTALSYGGHTMLDILTKVAEKMGIDTTDQAAMLNELFAGGFSSEFLSSLSQSVLEVTPTDLGPIFNLFQQINWESIKDVDWTTHQTNADIVAVLDSLSIVATDDHNFNSELWFGDLSMFQVFTQVAKNLNISTDNRTEMLTTLFSKGFRRKVKNSLREFLSTVSSKENVESIWYFFKHLDWRSLHDIDWTLVETETETEIESIILHHSYDDWRLGTISFGDHSLLEILTALAEDLNVETGDQAGMLDGLFSNEPNEDFFTALHSYIEEECSPEDEQSILGFFNHLDWTTLQTIDWESHTNIDDLGAIFHGAYDPEGTINGNDGDDDDHDGNDHGSDSNGDDDDDWYGILPTWWWKPDPGTTDPTPTIWYPPWLTTTTSTKAPTTKPSTVSGNTTSVSTTTTSTTTTTPIVPICV